MIAAAAWRRPQALRRAARVAGLFCLCLLGAATSLAAQRVVLETEPPPAGVFATVGLGVIDVEPGTGLDVALGLTAIAPTRHVMATLTAFDFGLLQGRSGDVRYQRFFDTRFGQEICVDTVTNQLASFARCAGDTDVLRSVTVDLSFLPVSTLFVGDKAGSLHTGLGWRARDPKTVYGTIGMFFPSHSGKAAGVRLCMGRDYIFLGFAWGMNVRRALDLF